MKTNISNQQMKSNRGVQRQESNAKANHSGKRPDNKNNLDSREGEEQVKKGDDVTHNKKEKHNQPSKHK
jgi:hypothetical protein